MRPPERLRLAALRWVLPGLLGGARPAVWARLRRRHPVDAPFRVRALAIALAVRETEGLARREEAAFGPAVARTAVEAPLFVLGHFRSGTTLLHGLLAADPALRAPGLLEVLNPWTFLSAEPRHRRRLAALLPATRVYDAVRLHADAPQEDELALAAMTGTSPYLRLAFPRAWAEHERALTLRGLPAAEVDGWAGALLHFTRKLTLKHGRRLVLKSPPHTARIPHLLRLFPDARFVFVHRHPLAVLPSMQRMVATSMPAAQLQRADALDLDAALIASYRAMLEAYLATRAAVGDGRLVEVSYSALVADPLGTVRRLYAALDLPGWEDARPAIERAALSATAFPQRRATPPPAPRRHRIARDLAFAYAAWGYDDAPDAAVV